jgi:hypothetical protein
MRTKTLLITAALCAAGAATSMAQVYSVNMVGYINKTLPTGFSLVANQLNASPDNKITTLLPAPPNSTTIYKFNRATQLYDNMTFVTGLGWDDGGTGVAATMTANPGEGFFIFVDPTEAPTGLPVTFVGEVQLSSSVAINTGFQIISSALPQSLPLEGAPPVGLGFVPQNGDTVYRFNPATQLYLTDEYIAGLGWQGDAGNVAPTVQVGEAFFLSATTGARSWTRTFTVGP